MKVLYRKQIVLPFQDPLFLIHPLALGAMSVATTIVMHLYVPAIGASRPVLTQHMGAALLYVPNQFELFNAYCVIFDIIISKAIEHPCHRWHGLLLPGIQRAEGFQKRYITYMKINHGGFYRTVPQQVLQCFQVHPFFQGMGGKAVPEDMEVHFFFDA